MSETSPAATPAPASIPLGSAPDLATYREARSKGLTEIPAPASPAAAAPVEDAAPDPEVEGNPELRSEIDSLEAPKENETPAEKAARTKRHKEAARKGYATRMANKAAREAERAAALERELHDLRQRQPTPPAQATTPATPATAETADPSDPEPTLEAYVAAHPDDADPYAGWLKTWNRWDRRQEQAAARRASEAESSSRAQGDALQAFDRHADALRRVHADFDAKVNSLPLTGPMVSAVLGAGELGPQLAYALASTPDLYRRIAALPPAAQYLELGALKATVSAAATAAKTTPQPITAAPAPHTPVGAGATATGTKKPGDISSVEEWRAVRDQVLSR